MAPSEIEDSYEKEKKYFSNALKDKELVSHSNGQNDTYSIDIKWIEDCFIEMAGFPYGIKPEIGKIFYSDACSDLLKQSWIGAVICQSDNSRYLPVGVPNLFNVNKFDIKDHPFSKDIDFADFRFDVSYDIKDLFAFPIEIPNGRNSGRIPSLELKRIIPKIENELLEAIVNTWSPLVEINSDHGMYKYINDRKHKVENEIKESNNFSFRKIFQTGKKKETDNLLSSLTLDDVRKWKVRAPVSPVNKDVILNRWSIDEVEDIPHVEHEENSSERNQEDSTLYVKNNYETSIKISKDKKSRSDEKVLNFKDSPVIDKSIFGGNDNKPAEDEINCSEKVGKDSSADKSNGSSINLDYDNNPPFSTSKRNSTVAGGAENRYKYTLCNPPKKDEFLSNSSQESNEALLYKRESGSENRNGKIIGFADMQGKSKRSVNWGNLSRQRSDIKIRIKLENENKQVLTLSENGIKIKVNIPSLKDISPQYSRGDVMELEFKFEQGKWKLKTSPKKPEKGKERDHKVLANNEAFRQAIGELNPTLQAGKFNFFRRLKKNYNHLIKKCKVI